ncbi:MAG: hypothetical protein Kow0047_29050 [Anaerolineae bacterium]
MKRKDLRYPALPDFPGLTDALIRYSRLAAEFGYADEAKEILSQVEKTLRGSVERFARLVENPKPDEDEPEDLEAIRSQRPPGKRRLLDRLPDDYDERWLGSLLGRGAGCTLGAAVEFWSVQEMENWARYFGEGFPPTDYWSRVKNPYTPRYIVGESQDLTRGHIVCIPVDDDLAYTLIGLLTLEHHGPEFTHEQMAETWQRYFPHSSRERELGRLLGGTQLARESEPGDSGSSCRLSEQSQRTVGCSLDSG